MTNQPRFFSGLLRRSRLTGLISGLILAASSGNAAGHAPASNPPLSVFGN